DLVAERIWCYHNTPHSSRGVAPFVLLKGRYSCNELSPEWVVEETRKGRVTPDIKQVKERVEKLQGRSKLRYDNLKSVWEMQFGVGDKVRVKRPHGKRSGESSFYPVT
ncbi:hypothetical protein NDU88_002628, partial [Pleurodeles waltl]